MKNLLLLLLLINFTVFSQNLENSKWYFGNEAALDFNNPGSNPSVLNNSVMNTIEGAASVSDSSGNLLFYTDGDQVWDSSHNQMMNGFDLGGHPSSTQSAVIVPDPSNCNLYYIFTSNGVTGDTDVGFYYSTVDMALNSGLGDVETLSKQQSLFFNTPRGTGNLNTSRSEKLTSFYDSATDDIWIVLYHENMILSFRVDENGVDDTAIFSAPALGTVLDESGSMKVSPDGNRLAVANRDGSTAVYDFNAGVVTNGNLVPGLPSAYGLEFSPDNNFLYASNQLGISQLDISTTLNGTPNLISSGNFGSLQLGNNDKIYVARENSAFLGVINNPNNTGGAANFVLNGQTLGSNTSVRGLPQKVAAIDLLCSTDFITTWQVDPSDTSITIPTHLGETYNYDVDWGDGNSNTVVTGDITHNYGSTGIYTVHIKGDFPRIRFTGSSDDPSWINNNEKIISVDNWGSQVWTSMEYAFLNCNNLNISATDSPDLSIATSMKNMFQGASSINQSIDNWDVSNITDMGSLFINAITFNQPLNNWNLSNVTNMSHMFAGATNFNQPLNNWDVGNVTNMHSMFYYTAFNQPLNNWDVSNVTIMSHMFAGTNFNQTLNNWIVSNVTYMNNMFASTTNFNQSLNNWNVSNVTSMQAMFGSANAFNQPLNNWIVANVTDMSGMFSNTVNFNQSLNNWNVSNVTDMSGMFAGTSVFNQPLNNWIVSNVTDMRNMFGYSSAFNQSINSWNVSNVTTMKFMFNQASAFDQPLNNWIVTNVTNMYSMFNQASAFNQPLNNWNVTNVTDMYSMFYGASVFNQPLGDWNVINVNNQFTLSGPHSGFYKFLNDTNLSINNYDHLLSGWSTKTLKIDLDFYAGNTKYCNSTARQSIINDFNWTFNDGGLDPGCRISNNSIKLEEDNVIIYPNPTSSLVEVNFIEDIEFNSGTIELSNTFGVLLSKEKYTNKEKITFDLSKQLRGVYFLKFTNNNGDVTIKKVIKH